MREIKEDADEMVSRKIRKRNMERDWDKEKVIKMAHSRVITYSGKTLCDNYRNPLERCETAAQAIRLYKNCISWALQERYPTKDDMLAFASREVWADNGVYIDKHFAGERIDSHICCVFIGCSGCIRTGLNVEKSIIPMLYLSECSNMKIKVDDTVTYPVPVELYYGSRVGGNVKRLRIKDCNRLTTEDNVGFTEEAENTPPDMDNELL